MAADVTAALQIQQSAVLETRDEIQSTDCANRWMNEERDKVAINKTRDDGNELADCFFVCVIFGKKKGRFRTLKSKNLVNKSDALLPVFSKRMRKRTFLFTRVVHTKY